MSDILFSDVDKINRTTSFRSFGKDLVIKETELVDNQTALDGFNALFDAVINAGNASEIQVAVDAIKTQTDVAIIINRLTSPIDKLTILIADIKNSMRNLSNDAQADPNVTVTEADEFTEAIGNF